MFLGLFFLLLGLALAFCAGIIAGHRFALYVRVRNWWTNRPRWPRE